MRHQEEDQFRDFFSRCCYFSLAAWFCTPPIWRRELADNGWRCTFWHAPSSAGFLNLYNKMVVILNYKLTNKKHYFAISGAAYLISFAALLLTNSFWCLAKLIVCFDSSEFHVRFCLLVVEKVLFQVDMSAPFITPP